MDRLRLRRQGMPCKQARKVVSGDGPKTVSISRERSVRAVADDKNPDTDVRRAFPNLRRRRCRSDSFGPLRNVSGSLSSNPVLNIRTRLSSTGKGRLVTSKNLPKSKLVPSKEISRTRSRLCPKAVRMRRNSLPVSAILLYTPEYSTKIDNGPDRIVLTWLGL
jgi:hypothetical protein